MKLCINCMAKMRDEKEICPFCGCVQSEGVKSSYHLLPGKSKLQNGRYLVGKAVSWDQVHTTYIGWDFQRNCKVTIQEYMPTAMVTRQPGVPLITCEQSVAGSFGEGISEFLNTAVLMKEQEIQLANLPKVIDVFAENGTGYYIEEYLQGQRLQELLEQEHIFPYESAKQIILEIMAGVESLHRMGIYHQDICPENILLTTDGRIAIMGVGGYRYAMFRAGEAVERVPRSMVTRKGYSPIELCQNHGMIGPYTDVYAIAALLYRMVTGKEVPDAVERAMDAQMIPPRELQPDMPVSGQNAILNALQFEPEERTQDIAQFQQQLLAQHVERTGSRQKAKITTGKRKKNMVVLLSAIGMVCLLVVGGVVLLVSRSQSESVRLGEGSGTVPNLLQNTKEDAEQKAGKKGMTIKVSDVVPSSLKENDVVSQTPEAGEEIGADGVIEITISGGSSRTTMPNLLGKTEREATALLRERELSIDESMTEHVYTQGEDSQKYTRGQIIQVKDGAEVLNLSGKSAEEAVVPQGSVFQIVVSKGDYEQTVPLLEIPDLTGLSLEQADTQLATLSEQAGNLDAVTYGLEEVGNREFSNTVAAGRIIRLQDHQTGEKLRPVTEDGTQIVLGAVISKGPELVLIPSVTGKKKADAASAITGRGLQVSYSSEYSNSVDAGKVIRTNPGEGSGVRPGSTVTVVVSLGKKPKETKEKPTEVNTNTGTTAPSEPKLNYDNKNDANDFD